MYVYATCKSCTNEIRIFTNANTRVEFAMQDGEHKILTCKQCGTKTKFSVDELYAKKSKRAQIIAGLVFFIGTPLMLFFVGPVFLKSNAHYVIYAVGGFLLVPGYIFGIIKKQDRIRVNAFNRMTLKG
ncbi:Sec62 family protein translocation protein [Formosa algae]|uniref:hypothetical protein n=1 Tax=Formosa algae TaxID=225843 RepID=UPI000CCF4015|nr:hypothetical protein [Formosa algae]PNW28702.1 hypothetical protein BKP44_07225 [Formosa algae]